MADSFAVQDLGVELLPAEPGALVLAYDLLQKRRREFGPIVDPAVSTGADADETGIIVAGKDADGHGYVLADQSARYAGLRHGGGGAGARPRDRPRASRGGSVGPYRRVEVRRSPAALSPGRDLRPRRGEPGDLDPVRLGWGDSGGAAAARRRPRCRRPLQRDAACRRHTGAGPGAGYR